MAAATVWKMDTNVIFVITVNIFNDFQWLFEVFIYKLKNLDTP